MLSLTSQELLAPVNLTHLHTGPPVARQYLVLRFFCLLSMCFLVCMLLFKSRQAGVWLNH